MGRAILLLFFFIPSYSVLWAQPAQKRVTLDDYVSKWKDAAVQQMHEHGIPASITLAQGILESGYGNSPLARYANNHFGIKCNGWNGRKFYKDDDHKDDCFRKYYNAERSYEDHAEFLTKNARYAFLFEIAPSDYKAWARGLKRAGYATAPDYPERLIAIIEKHDLTRFDSVPGMEKKTPQVVEKERRKLENVEIRGGRRVYRHPNSIDMVEARKGDSFSTLARDLDISKERLLEYNDMNPTDRLSKGDTIYIQPKRNWHRKRKIYEAKEDDSMWEIAHRFGLKLEKLYDRNKMVPGTQPEPGQRIYLRGRRDTSNNSGFFQRLFGKKDEG